MTTTSTTAATSSAPKENALDQFLDKIENGVDDIITLNIQTLIGNMEVGPDGKVAFQDNQTINGMISNVNLIDGDIKTQITADFYNNYPNLVKFHQAKEVQGQQIIKGNIVVLKKIFETLTEFYKK